MNRLRAFFRNHRVMAFAMIALALAMKALVPTGYMVGGDARVLTIRVCDGYVDSAPAHAIVIAAQGHDGANANGGHGEAGKALHDQQACPFSALAHAGLAGADPLLLAAALAYILLLGFAAPGFVAPVRLVRLRPPLRAPPA